jgi:hypothetical protein
MRDGADARAVLVRGAVLPGSIEDVVILLHVRYARRWRANHFRRGHARGVRTYPAISLAASIKRSISSSLV